MSLRTFHFFSVVYVVSHGVHPNIFNKSFQCRSNIPLFTCIGISDVFVCLFVCLFVYLFFIYSAVSVASAVMLEIKFPRTRKMLGVTLYKFHLGAGDMQKLQIIMDIMKHLEGCIQIAESH